MENFDKFLDVVAMFFYIYHLGMFVYLHVTHETGRAKVETNKLVYHAFFGIVFLILLSM